MKQTIARWLLLVLFGHFGLLVLAVARMFGWSGVIGVRIRGFNPLFGTRKKIIPVPKEGLIIYYRTHIMKRDFSRAMNTETSSC